MNDVTYSLVGYINEFDVYPCFVDLIFTKDKKYYRQISNSNQILSMKEISSNDIHRIVFFSNDLQIIGELQAIDIMQCPLFCYQVGKDKLIVKNSAEMLSDLIEIYCSSSSALDREELLYYINEFNLNPTNIFIGKKNIRKKYYNNIYLNKGPQKAKTEDEIWNSLLINNEKINSRVAAVANDTAKKYEKIFIRNNNITKSNKIKEGYCIIHFNYNGDDGWVAYSYDLGKRNVLRNPNKFSQKSISRHKWVQICDKVNKLELKDFDDCEMNENASLLSQLFNYFPMRDKNYVLQTSNSLKRIYELNPLNVQIADLYLKSLVNCLSIELTKRNRTDIFSQINSIKKSFDNNIDMKLSYGYSLVNLLSNNDVTQKQQTIFTKELYDLYYTNCFDIRFNEMYMSGLVNISNYLPINSLKILIGKMMVNYKQNPKNLLIKQLYTRGVYNTYIECAIEKKKREKKQLRLELNLLEGSIDKFDAEEFNIDKIRQIINSSMNNM